MEEEKFMDSRLVLRYSIREALGLVGMAVALFWSAGKVLWWPAWGALAVMAAWTAATAVIIYRYNPELLRERLGPRQGARRWDAAIVSSLGLVTLARYIVAGLDERYGWSGDFPSAAQIAALLVCALGYAVFTWATYSNAYFSQIVRIQSERGHAVVSGGPYRWVRHPAYAGAILYELAVSILLASWWSLAISALSAGLLVLRTALEDRFLMRELDAYSEYAGGVRYRLLPGVW